MKFMKRFGTNMGILLPLILVLLVLPSYGEQQENIETYFSKFIADLWLEGADIVRIIWRDCSKKLVDVQDVIDHQEYFPKFVRCMKRKTLRAVDRSLSRDVVPVGVGVSLVRFELHPPSGNVSENLTSTWSDKELDENDWRTLVLQRMARVLKTHVVKFDLEGNHTVLDQVEFRGRRRHHMLTMMMFGIVSIGMVLVPMGFQFLAVLGGKALLLAKMALVLASIQGLKKIATSPVSYGFYHSYPPPYEHFQRRSRGSPSVIPSISHAPIPDNAAGFKNDKIDGILVYNDKRIEEDFKEYADKENLDRQFPVYQLPEPSGSIETPLVDSTTKPGEVQADFALDLPYNRFRFQTPTSVVSA